MIAKSVRIAVDIGGTFTDVALEPTPNATDFITVKTPTTPKDPVAGALTGIQLVLEKANVMPSQVSAIVHGTTLATNALIERKGATVATITTAGFRDILEIAYERRYNQYDIFLDKPDKYVPRERCFTISERMMANGEVLKPLAIDEVDDLLAALDRHQVESIAICLLHAYANNQHEMQLAELIHAKRPDLFVSLSSLVSPEAREYDRLCTTVANAYIQPLMGTYLKRFATELRAQSMDCPLYIMTSGGGMTTLETARTFPIRLVESGPSGGAILAATVAKQCNLDEVISFDMGGTTAKLCLIDQGQPQTSRHFEIARAERFMKGSGLPVRIPVIEMIEIGAGGGSIAKLDRLKRVTVGPESAGSEPGPACFNRGGVHPTVTDSDVVLGHIDVSAFAEGRLQIAPTLAEAAVQSEIGTGLALTPAESAYAIAQIVDENMASAGRVHAVERGKALPQRTMIAFGGNGPLHASRVAEKMNVNHIVIPADPGVGSAIGFLFAPVSYEIVRSHYTTLDAFDFAGVNALFSNMLAEASQIVQAGALGQTLVEKRIAFMRYKGQGHEIEVELPNRMLAERDLPQLLVAYEAEYKAQFHRTVPSMTIEVMNWAMTVATAPQAPNPTEIQSMQTRRPTPQRAQEVYFGRHRGWQACPIFDRSQLTVGSQFDGPALIVEAQTTTLVPDTMTVIVDAGGNLHLNKVQGGA